MNKLQFDLYLAPNRFPLSVNRVRLKYDFYPNDRYAKRKYELRYCLEKRQLLETEKKIQILSIYFFENLTRSIFIPSVISQRSDS